MEIHKTIGVVLSSRPSGEADVSARLYTRDFGKNAFIFKGIRKSRKRPLISTEPGTVIELLYYFHENKDFSIVNESRVAAHYQEIRKNLHNILYLFLLLELIDKTTGLHDPNQSLFTLLVTGLETLSYTQYVENLAFFFILRLLKTHGIVPDFLECKKCGRNNFIAYTLEYTDLSPVCDKCSTISERNDNSFSVQSGTYIRQSLNNKFSVVNHNLIDREELRSLLFRFVIFIENYYHTEIKSKNMVFHVYRQNNAFK